MRAKGQTKGRQRRVPVTICAAPAIGARAGILLLEAKPETGCFKVLSEHQ